MNSRRIEILVGAFVLLGLLALGHLTLKAGGRALTDGEGYVVRARFTNVGGLRVGATVSLGGVAVGRVEEITLDASFAAFAALRLRGDLRLPVDSLAAIRSSGLIGEKFVALSPGALATPLEAGSVMLDTQSSVDLEDLISRFAFGSVDGK